MQSILADMRDAGLLTDVSLAMNFLSIHNLRITDAMEGCSCMRKCHYMCAYGLNIHEARYLTEFMNDCNSGECDRVLTICGTEEKDREAILLDILGDLKQTDSITVFRDTDRCQTDNRVVKNLADTHKGIIRLTAHHPGKYEYDHGTLRRSVFICLDGKKYTTHFSH